VKWSEDTLARITARLTSLGLTTCPICDGGTLAAWRKPVILPVGGSAWSDHADVSRGSDIRYMVAMVCDLCGHTGLFDSEKLDLGDHDALEPD
jgi:hypothetical protein